MMAAMVNGLMDRDTFNPCCDGECLKAIDRMISIWGDCHSGHDHFHITLMVDRQIRNGLVIRDRPQAKGFGESTKDSGTILV
jgi:hypothetical protein